MTMERCISGVAKENIGARIYFAPRYYGQPANALYVEINGAQPLVDSVRLLVHVGWLSTRSTYPYGPQVEQHVVDGRIGLGVDFDLFHIELAWVGINSSAANNIANVDYRIAWKQPSEYSRPDPVAAVLDRCCHPVGVVPGFNRRALASWLHRRRRNAPSCVRASPAPGPSRQVPRAGPQCLRRTFVRQRPGQVPRDLLPEVATTVREGRRRTGAFASEGLSVDAAPAAGLDSRGAKEGAGPRARPGAYRST